ncbi:MAG: hypothetical protein ACE5FC_08575 [Myxococcota bacterium]
MVFGRCASVVVLLLFLPGVRAGAQDREDIAELREALKAQQALNEALMKRLEAVEAGQAALLEKLQTLDASPRDEEEIQEEDRAMIEELREEYFDLQDRLDRMPTLSGYYDVEYFNDDRSDSPGEFRQHHVSLHISREWERWRLFSESEFEYGGKFEGDGGTALEEARGEVKLEQAWGEYLHSDALTLRGGLILTPGYWNVRHYPNVVLSTRRPLMVRNVFREAFVGMMGYGAKYWDELGVTYYGYVGNGQSVFFPKHDDNEGKAVGGKVTLHLPTKGRFDTLDVGLSFYQESPSGAQRNLTLGVDAQVRKGPWELLTEFAMRDAEKDRTGFYLQPSYRFNEKWATFYRYDLLFVRHVDETQEHTLGLNFRPIPDVSLKLEYFYSRHSRGEDFSGVATSLAIRF